MEDLTYLGVINYLQTEVYKVLWSKSKTLQSLGKIHSFFLSLVTQSKSKLMKIVFRCHVDNFRNYFPGVELSPLHVLVNVIAIAILVNLLYVIVVYSLV